MTKEQPPEIVRDVDEAIDILKHERILGLDLETGGLSPWKDPIAVVSLYGPKSKTAAVLHVRGHIPDKLKDFLEQPRTLVGHNIGGFDGLFLANNGVDIFQAVWYDTMIGEAAAMKSGRRDLSVSLKATLQRRLGRKISKEQQVSAWMAETLTPEQVAYCTDDIRLLPRLMETQMDNASGTTMRKAIEVEMMVLPMTMRMTLNGLPLNEAKFNAYIGHQREVLLRTSAQLFERFGRQINMNSPAQLKKALHDIGVPVASTASDELKALEMSVADAEGEIAQVIKILLECKNANQRVKVYSDEWIEKYVIDGWLHARFWQCGTETLRYSSSNPNFQQIPRDMRSVFGWVDGSWIVSADYSQIEVRIAAALAKDRVLLAALANEDVHSAIASLVFSVPLEKVTSEQRMMSKAMTFTLLFGGGVDRLYQYAKLNGSAITRDDAENNFNDFFRRFGGLHRMRLKASQLSREYGPLILTLPTGAQRVLVGGQKTMQRILNTSVQGTAAAGLKFALIEAQRRGLERYLGCTVHDELVACVPGSKSQAEEYAHELEEAMKHGMLQAIEIPVKVEAEVAEAWSLQGGDKAPNWLRRTGR
jgi:DNA polymerase I